MFRKDRGSDRPARPKPGQRGGDAPPKLDSAGPTLARSAAPKKTAGGDGKASQPARAPWPKPTPPGVTPNRLTALLGEPVTRPATQPLESPASEPRRETGKRMHIGQDISISGEITTCDVLVVDGHVDAKVRDCGRLEIGPAGTLCGDVEVKNAEIGGRFDGVLNVTDRLTVRGTGRVNGTVRYGRLEVTVGGQLRGDIAPAEEREEAAEPAAAAVASAAGAAAEVPPPALDRPSAASILKPAARPTPATGPAAGQAPEAASAESAQQPEPIGPAVSAPSSPPSGSAPASGEADATAEHAGVNGSAGPVEASTPATGAPDDSADPTPDAAKPDAPERGAVTKLLGQRAAE